MEKTERRSWKPPKHHRSNQKLKSVWQEEGIQENTNEKRPILDGSPENQHKAENNNIRNASKSNRKLNPRTQQQTDSRG